MLSTLVDHGANINAVTSSGTTPLITAVEADAEEVVEFLLENGADPNVKMGDRVGPFSLCHKLGKREKRGVGWMLGNMGRLSA